MDESRFRALSMLVGNTPLLAIRYTLHGVSGTVYAKSENLNMTGSVKDRMALHILHCAHERGTLHPDATVVEASSGNTGISFSGIGRALGLATKVFMPDWMSRERVSLIRSFGAETTLVSEQDGGFLGSIKRAEAYACADPTAFLPRQFSNDDNIAAHATTTGPEIWDQLASIDLRPDAFLAGVGTGGTIMGVGRYLRSRSPGIKLHPLEPANSPTLRTGVKNGHHRIQGVSDEFIPPIVDLTMLDSIVDVDDGDAILMAQHLATELGLGVGISSGANMLGAIKIHQELGPDAVVVTILPDSNKKYLSTDLFKTVPPGDHLLTTGIDLQGFDVITCASSKRFRCSKAVATGH